MHQYYPIQTSLFWERLVRNHNQKWTAKNGQISGQLEADIYYY